MLEERPNTLLVPQRAPAWASLHELATGPSELALETPAKIILASLDQPRMINYLSSEMDGLVDTLITSDTPMDSTRSSAE